MKRNKKLEFQTIEKISMILQVVFLVILIVMGIISIFNKELIYFCKLIIGLLMIILSFNNYKIYKRKYMTIMYFGLGIVILAKTIFA